MDAKKLVELYKDRSRHTDASCNYCREMPDVLDTLSLALAVVRAAKETRDAAAYLMRFISDHMDPKFINRLDHKYDGFGKRIDDALAPFRAEPGERGR